MERLVLLVVLVFAMQVGCQAPVTGFDPLAMGRQTRVPPPPTGVVGRSAGGYSTPAPQAPGNAGASHWPATNLAAPAEYWEPATQGRDPLGAAQSPAQTPPASARSLATSSPAPRQLELNDRLSWRQQNPPARPRPVPTYAEFSRQQPTGSSFPPSYPPRLMPTTGLVTPLASAPPRLRGFTSSQGRQEIRIPAELAEFQNNGIRQASAPGAGWQPRYDDVRR